MIPTFPGYARAAAAYYREPDDDDDGDRDDGDLESEDATEEAPAPWWQGQEERIREAEGDYL